MSNYFFYSVLGLCGGILCAIGDILLDVKGRDNVKCGSSGLIESNWVTMAASRFRLSILFALPGVWLYAIGIYALGGQMSEESPTIGELMRLSSILCAMGGFFIHSFICAAPIVYKKALECSEADTAEAVVVALFSAIKFPFFLLFALLLLLPSSLTVYAIFAGVLDVPLWFVCLNPVVFLFLGLGLRRLKPAWFYEMPSIFMPSLGLGMFGVIGMVHAL